MLLAEKLKQLRKAKGWTQAQAAANIEIQQSYLSKLENSLFAPSSEVLKKLAKAYQVPVTELSQDTHKQRLNAPTLNIGLICIAITLLLFGSLGVVFSDTYYTYQLKTDQHHTISRYHLTDKYLGERYDVGDAKNNGYYQLIGQRTISRKENNGLIVLGSVLLILGCYRQFKTVISSRSSD